MASPALASRRSRFLLRPRVSAPGVALADIVDGVVCATLCVEGSEKAFSYYDFRFRFFGVK
jgi:hypothetical protein